MSTSNTRRRLRRFIVPEVSLREKIEAPVCDARFCRGARPAQVSDSREGDTGEPYFQRGATAVVEAAAECSGAGGSGQAPCIAEDRFAQRPARPRHAGSALRDRVAGVRVDRPEAGWSEPRGRFCPVHGEGKQGENRASGRLGRRSGGRVPEIGAGT